MVIFFLHIQTSIVLSFFSIETDLKPAVTAERAENNVTEFLAGVNAPENADENRSVVAQVTDQSDPQHQYDVQQGREIARGITDSDNLLQLSTTILQEHHGNI